MSTQGSLVGQAEIGLMPISTTDRLKGEKERLEQRLEAVNQAIAALKANPEIQNAIDAISKLGYF
jgi:hypothetical protein